MKPAIHHDATVLDAGSVSRLLSCPIIFDEPDRVVFPPSWCGHIPFAFWIVDALRPNVFVELGTHSGNSYAAFAQAIQRLGLPTAGYSVDTWIGDPQTGFYDEAVFTDWSRYHDRRFSGFSRLVRSTFAEAVEYFPDRSVDLLHIDGYHTFDAISEDFELWRPKMSDRGVVLMHDINVREREFGAWRFWDRIQGQYPSFAFLHGHGLGVLGLGANLPAPVAWLLSHAPAHPEESATVRALFARLGGVVVSRYAEESLRAEVGEKSARLTGLEAAAARLRDDVQQLEALRPLVEMNAELERALGHLQVEHDGAAEDLALTRQHVDDLRLQLETLRPFVETNTELQGALGHLQSVYDRAAGDLDQVRQQVDELRLQLQDRDEQLRVRTNHLERLGIEVSQVREEVSQVRERVSQLREEVRERDEALAQRAREADRLGERLASVTTDAQAAQDTLAREKARARDQVARLEASTSWRFMAPLRGAARAVRLLWHSGVADERLATATTAVLFDAKYYLGCYPEVAASGLDPLAEYLQTGWREYRNPHPIFDTLYYLQRYPDVAASGMNPFVHYLTAGGLEGRDPHPLFQSRYYLDENPDVAAARMNPLVHFVRFGGAEGRNPHPFFDSAFYLARNSDVASAQVNPLIHFLTCGAAERRDPNGQFVTAFYIEQNPAAAAPGTNPLVHYLQVGQRNGRLCRPPATGSTPA